VMNISALLLRDGLKAVPYQFPEGRPLPSSLKAVRNPVGDALQGVPLGTG